MSKHVSAISARLSLRAPQRESLEILSRVVEIAPPNKHQDLDTALSIIKSEFPSAEDFERDFPSLCFALATGVGKTRLMGAFITYLYLEMGIRHFFVLAPNLTIYNKLITDFTPNTPKYVFQGISEFATNPPLIITGDNYERGHGVRSVGRLQLGFFDEDVHINIFNISKINTEVRGGRAPRIKRLSEYIGESYFDYLAGLEDLVLLMDESHRYRASAGIRAINELKPILGLELTATPQIEAGRKSAIPFQNVVYSYPLHEALKDGFVKEPAVATRENFDASELSPEQLERLKLEDGVRVHEAVKVELEVYARQYDQQIVKPFMLVIAQDTEHANDLVEQVKDPSFFEGRYADKVIQVHSKVSGEEGDETIQRLLAVESPAEPTEIVVHVNMLKEGWDVTNLYTIVPLRAANSRTLIEQSIGRGLRLPYGKRVGVPAVDRLTIVAHDRFQEIIDEANRGDSIIRTGVVIGRDIPISRPKTVVVKPEIERIIDGTAPDDPRPSPARYDLPQERAVARAAFSAIRKLEHLPSSRELQRDEIQAQIAEQVRIEVTPYQNALPFEDGAKVDVESIVREVADVYTATTIDIPKIVIVPRGEVTSGFSAFSLNTDAFRMLPITENILLQDLRTNSQSKLAVGNDSVLEARLEDYVVRKLIDFNDISYDEHADLLYALANQVVEHLRGYLASDDEVRNVLVYYQEQIGNLVYAQMQDHRWESATGYDVEVTRGFTQPDEETFSAPASESLRDFRVPVDDRLRVQSMLFGGFSKCLYPIQKFSTDTERRFAVLIENDSTVIKWVKPARTAFRIYFRGDEAYEPDFVVETATRKYICEPKRRRDLQDATVQAKARAAAEWCSHATEHERQHGGKPWSYVLIPHDAITDAMTLDGLAARFEYSLANQ